MKTIQKDIVSYLLALFQSLVLLVAWPSGKKGCKGVDFTKITLKDMMDPEYRRRLAEGNIGVVQGEASGGIGSIDIDDDHGAEEFLALNPALRDTLRTRGARGCNVWFYPEGDVPFLAALAASHHATQRTERPAQDVWRPQRPPRLRRAGRRVL